MSKVFGIIGPFNLEESIALSTSNPHECVPWEWGNKTHLESAGSTCLSLGRNGKYYGCHSQHANNLSTVVYKKIPVVLCQVDNAKGMFIFSRNKAKNFVKGFENLVNNKIDPESTLNKEHNKLKNELLLELNTEITNPLAPKKILAEIETIRHSGILKPSNPEILSRIKAQKYPTLWISKDDLEQFIKMFYGDHLGGIIHTGIALYHLNLPTDHLIKSALDEQITICRRSLKDPKLEKAFRKKLNSAKALFT